MATCSDDGSSQEKGALLPVLPGHKARRHSRTRKMSKPSSEEQLGPVMPPLELFSMMTIKRLARQMASKAYAKRSVQPTYRMEPTVLFNCALVHEIITQMLDFRLRDFKYSASKAAVLARVLSEEIKNQLKLLQFSRYKMVCVVSVGQKLKQDLRLTSRCVWDPSCDNYVTVTWQNADSFCTVTLYGVYHE